MILSKGECFMGSTKEDTENPQCRWELRGRGFRHQMSRRTLRNLFRASIALALLCTLGARTGMPQADKPGTLMLDQAVQFALQHSPDLQTSTAETRKQEGNVKSAKSPLLPQVDLLADASRYRVDHGILPGADPLILHFDNVIYTTGAEAHLLVWDFGKTRPSLKRRASAWTPANFFSIASGKK